MGTGRRPQHDQYFRTAFVQPGVLPAEVQAVLPEPLWRQLDLGQVRAMRARFTGVPTPDRRLRVRA
jgi:hypothetical protein